MAEPQKDNEQVVASTPRPGMTIPPASSPVSSPAPTPPDSPAAPVAAPQAPQVTQQVPQAPPFEADSPPAKENADSLTWTASEFHAHEKSLLWYIKLALVTIAVAAVLYFLTKSVFTPVVIAVCGLVLGIYGSHKPDQLEYTMTRQGIRIGSKQYLYDDFRLFVITPASSLPEVTLIPAKRFMPPISIRYSPEIEAKVLNVLADVLPFEERRPDPLDSLMQRMHF